MGYKSSEVTESSSYSLNTRGHSEKGSAGLL